MIRATCFTNLDEYKQVEWPQGFAALPRIGDKVEGRRGRDKPVLRVVAITHGWLPNAGEPTITVELHK